MKLLCWRAGGAEKGRDIGEERGKAEDQADWVVGLTGV